MLGRIDLGVDGAAVAAQYPGRLLKIVRDRSVDSHETTRIGFLITGSPPRLPKLEAACPTRLRPLPYSW